MGNWNINIQGVGCHHNTNNPTDANLLTEDFIKRLKAAGHWIEHANFTHGGKDYAVEASVTTVESGRPPA